MSGLDSDRNRAPVPNKEVTMIEILDRDVNTTYEHEKLYKTNTKHLEDLGYVFKAIVHEGQGIELKLVKNPNLINLI
jgi:hypothetical protein